MKRVLVTGAGGFIGSQTLPLLVHGGFEVHGVSRQVVRSGGSSDVQWHRVDLLDSQASSALVHSVKPSHLLHLAWYTEPGLYWTSLENVRWAEASLSLLRAFSSSGGQRAVAAGTCAEYDWTYGLCSEEVTPLKPRTLYGSCKAALQTAAAAATDELGITMAWGRVFFLYGPGEDRKRLVSSVITSLLEGRETPCTHGRQIRDFLHGYDVAAALVHLLESKLEGPTNIASGVPTAVAHIIERIGQIVGRPDLIRIGQLPAAVDEAPLVVGDNRRLQRDGWHPSFTIQAGLEQTVTWWRQEYARR